MDGHKKTGTNTKGSNPLTVGKREPETRPTEEDDSVDAEELIGEEEMSNDAGLQEDDFTRLREFHQHLENELDGDDDDDGSYLSDSHLDDDQEHPGQDGNEFAQLIADIENNSEDEGLEDYRRGGYHTVHVGYY